MNTAELRIGSIIESGVIERMDIGEIAVFSITVNANGKRRKISNPTPEPLTEDWLRKFGFTDTDDKTALAKDYVIINLPDASDGLPDKQQFNFVYEFDFMERLTVIKYVHQLQNLYFALTGEELTYIPSPLPHR